MNSVEARIAEVLAAHKAVRIQDLLRRDGAFTCACGSEFTGGPEGHLAHQAAALAPLIREAQAEVLSAAACDISGTATPTEIICWLEAQSEAIIYQLLSPECDKRQHQACDYRAFDLDNDEIVQCQCTCHQ